jgi:microcystin-dependent protein
MATSFPVSLDSLGNPSSGNTLNAPSHSTQHANANDAIEVLEAKVGVDNSAVTTSLDYKVRIGNPVGEIAMWSTNTAPTGWLLCDGIDKDRSTYSALHSLMQAAGYPFGAGNGSTTFGIPNLLGKFPVGKDASADFDVLGETGGGKTRVLGVSNLPAHDHTASSSSSSSSASSTSLTNGSSVVVTGTGNAYLLNGAQGLSIYGPYNAVAMSASTTTTTSTSTSTTVNTSGGNGTATGDAFNILPPYIALNFIIRF